MQSDILLETRGAVVTGRYAEIEALVRGALEAGAPPDTILNDVLIPAMEEVGHMFSRNEIYVPEMLVSAATMQKGLAILKPLLAEGGGHSRGLVLMGTVKGDLHDIGKNIVVMMLEGAGFTVADLGVDLDVERIVREVRERRPQVLGLSALLTTTMAEMKRAVEALEEAGLRESVRVMVGGAPVDERFAALIGADGYGKDAAAAVSLALKLARG